MAESGHTGQIRFGGFRFDEHSGELYRGDPDTPPLRLQPQPTRLLAHLIRRRPTIVSRDEIAELLWPQVEVDVEQSVHACIRQIRAALDDSATAPRFVETIPRRGYRFIGDVGEHREPGSANGNRHRPLTTATIVLAALVAVAALLIALAAFRSETVSAATPVRVAVMPFEPIGDDAVLNPGNGMAESILRILAAGSPPSLEVVGPTTTLAYDGKPQRLRELVDEFEIGLLVNARQTTTDGRVLIELIRGDDGAHVWVRYLDEFPPDRDPAEIIAEAVVEHAR